MKPYAEVIGDPISHSKSPLIHNFWLAKLGIDAEYRACHVRSEELADYFARRRDDAMWRGCNVTMPHKFAACRVADVTDMTVERAGAANTILRGRDNHLYAHNTDVIGVAQPLKAARGDWKPYENHIATYVQVIGAGGAARAAVLGAVQCGYGDFDFFNRTPSKAIELAQWLSLPDWFGHSLDELGPIKNPEDGLAEQRYSQVVINASSMGMVGVDPVPIDLSTYYPDTIVFDMVYAPLETELLNQAHELGLRTIDGLEMLIGQAAAAFELFFGQPAPRQHDAELRALLTA